MSSDPTDINAKFIVAYRKASQVLLDVRRSELVNVDVVKTLQSLLPAFDACVRLTPLTSYSGLIEQQRIFARSRQK